MNKAVEITPLIRQRRAIFPKMYTDRPIPHAVLLEILENANHAPTHKLTQPWRFKIFTGEARKKLGAELARLYKARIGDLFSERKYQKTLLKPNQSAYIIAICMQRDPAQSIPEWEEIAATACAVQNMWLTCTAHNIGSYWSSPATINDIGPFLQLKEGERCLGFFYMGYYEGEVPPTPRTPIADKIAWIDT